MATGQFVRSVADPLQTQTYGRRYVFADIHQNTIAMDTRVLAFALAMSVATGLLFGIAPALQAAAPELTGLMKDGGRGSTDRASRKRVRDILIVADQNPRAGVVHFRLSPLSGVAEANTRIRLAETQNVIALARMNDGAVCTDSKLVKVTIGGCGG